MPWASDRFEGGDGVAGLSVSSSARRHCVRPDGEVLLTRRRSVSATCGGSISSPAEPTRPHPAYPQRAPSAPSMPSSGGDGYDYTDDTQQQLEDLQSQLDGPRRSRWMTCRASSRISASTSDASVEYPRTERCRASLGAGATTCRSASTCPSSAPGVRSRHSVSSDAPRSKQQAPLRGQSPNTPRRHTPDSRCLVFVAHA